MNRLWVFPAVISFVIMSVPFVVILSGAFVVDSAIWLSTGKGFESEDLDRRAELMFFIPDWCFTKAGL